MKTTAKIMAVFFMVLALSAGNLWAETIIINITAEITGVRDPDGLLNGQLIVGDIITGSYTYDSSTPDSAPGPSVGRYLHYSPPYGINLSVVDVEGFVFQTDPNNVEFWVEVGNNNVATTDNYLIRSRNNLPLYDNVHVGIIDWQLDDSTGTALSSTALPTTAPVLENWDDEWGMRIDGGIPDEYGKFMESFLIEAPVISVELVPHQPKTYYVNAADGDDNNDGLSPQTPFATIQKAIDSAYNGDTVLVADGTYTGDGNRDINFLGKAITVRSESGPENCIIDCNGTKADPHRGFYFNNGEDANSILDGFTITNGYAPYGGGIRCKGSSPTIKNCSVIGNRGGAPPSGGGILCDQSSPNISNCTISGNISEGIFCLHSSPTITNCRITGNTYGGGIYCKNSSPNISNCIITGNIAEDYGCGDGIFCEDSTATITNCTIAENQGSGILVYDGSLTAVNCIITGNRANWGGGGIYCEDSTATITNCTINGNRVNRSGGGIYCEDSTATITNCTINGNTAERGAGICCCYGSTTITNCILTGNSAENSYESPYVYGGAIFCVGDNQKITNCTISGNSAVYSGGGIYCGGYSSPTITNCILWNNTASQGNQIAVGHKESTLMVSYSDVQGGQDDIYVKPGCSLNWGEGNIDADPYFVEPAYWADANDPNIIVEPNDPNAVWVEGDYHLLPDSPCIDAGDNNSVPADIHDLDGDGNTAEPLPFDLDGNPRFVDRPDIEDTGNGTPPIVDMGAYEAMVSCFGVNHVKLGTKAGKKGNKVEVKGTFDPASPIDFAVDDVTYTIDDGLDYLLTFIIPAGSFEQEGKGDKDKYKFHSPKGSVPDIKAKFDFDKCKFEFKAKKVAGIDEITSTSLEIILQAGANIAQEIVELEVKGKKGEHLEYKRKPKLNCCQM